jgi:S1-C subfamily serine protease
MKPRRILALVSLIIGLLASGPGHAGEINPAYCNALRDLAVKIGHSMRAGAPLEAAIAWASSREQKFQSYLVKPKPVLRPLIYYVYLFRDDRTTSTSEIGQLVYGKCQNGAYGTTRPRTVAQAIPGAGDDGDQSSSADTYSLGTGWPVAEGLVITNNHVIDGHDRITLVATDGRRIPATVLATDTTNDIALLSPDDSDQLPPALTIAKAAAPIGAEVFTIGYPHPDIMGSKPKLTTGVVNAETGLHDDPRTYQISVAVQSGNSGGPLINMKGEVVGVVTSKLSAVRVFQWTGDLPQNVNYAMKSSYVINMLKKADMDMILDEIPPKKDSLENLARRIEKSILIVVAH